MLLFAGHDPGAKNHLRPIYNHALEQGYTARFIDLAAGADFPEIVNTFIPSGVDPSPVLVCGSSDNRSEWPLISAGKSAGISTAMVLELQVKPRMDGVSQSDFPDRFLVTNARCVDELTAVGVRRETIVVTGSTYLEMLHETPPERTNLSLDKLYGVSPESDLVSFFSAPDTNTTIAAVNSLASLITKTMLEHPEIIVRPHPRMARKAKLEEASRRLGIAHYDSGDNLETPTLLLASKFSLSMASTVSLESIVLGVPSAFFQVGWDYNELDSRYENVESVLRIRTLQDFQRFVASVCGQEESPNPAELENYRGALSRSWGVIRGLMGQGS